MPTSWCSSAAAFAIRSRVSPWGPPRAFSSYFRIWVDTVFSMLPCAQVDKHPAQRKRGDMETTTTAKVVGPRDGRSGFLGSIGVRFMIDGDEAADRLSLVEHPMSAHALAAPLHRHVREDEYSYVVEGRIGALLGDEVVFGGPGDLIFKPRNQWHTFWNAGDEPARLLEIISPAGFERFFAELVDLGGVTQAEPEALGELCARYELEMDPDSIPGLVERFGVRFPGEPV